MGDLACCYRPAKLPGQRSAPTFTELPSQCHLAPRPYGRAGRLRNKSGAPSRWVIVNGSFRRSTARMCGDSLSCCSSRSTILRQNGCGLSDNSSTRPELKVAYSGAEVDCPLVMLERVSVFPTCSLGMPSEPAVFSLTNRRTRKATASAVKPMRAHDLNPKDRFTVFEY